MRKWAYLLVAAAAAIIGCGGSGGGSDSTSTAATSTAATSTATTGRLHVDIPTPAGYTRPPGRLEFALFSGQGRAIGDLSLVLNRVNLADEFGEVRTDLNARIDVLLSSFTFQILPLVIPMDQNQDSRLFESYTFDPTSLRQDTGSTPQVTSCFGQAVADGSFNRVWPPEPLAIDARVFPGRSTLVPIYIDDSMFRIETISDTDCSNRLAVFDDTRFRELNTTPIKGYINDYVEFDLSQMASDKRPPLTSTAGTASRLFVTGDNYALSAGGAAGAFEVLTPSVSEPIVGSFREPSQLPGATTPGTFTLEQLDPTDLFNKRKIVALQGIWRESNKVMSDFATWNFVTFPSSKDSFEQEALYFKQSNNKVTEMFYGFVNYDTKQVHLFPVKTIVDGIVDPADEVVGTVVSQADRNGNTVVAPQLTRTGSFNITKQGSLPGDAPTSGDYLVFRI